MTQASPSSAKRLANSTAIYAVSMFLGRIASVVMLPVYTRYLSPADYGVLELIDVSMVAAALLLGMGLTGDALYYFHARAASDDQRENLVNVLLISAFVCSLTGGLLLLAGAGWLSEILFHSRQYQTALRIAGFTFIATLPVETCLAFLRARDKAMVFMAFSFFRLGSNVLLNVIFLVGMGLGFYSVLLSALLGSILSIAGLLWYVYRGFGRWYMPDMSILWPVIKYSVPLGLGGLGMLTINFGDRFFLARSCTLADIGIYSLAYKFGMMMTYLNMPFMMFWRSQVHHIMKDGDAKGEKTFVRTFTFVAVFFGFAAYSLVILAPVAVRVIAGPAFQGAAVFVPWIAAAYLLRVLTSQLESGLLVGNKTKWLMVSDWLGGSGCLLGYTILIPRYGVWGSVAATFLAFLAMLIFVAIVSQHLTPRDFELRKIGVAYGLMIGLVLVASLVPPASGAVGLLVTAAFVVLAPLLLSLLPMFREERTLVLGLLWRLRIA